MFGKTQLEIIKEAMESGAKIAQDSFTMGCRETLNALERDGRLMPLSSPVEGRQEAVNIGEEDYTITDETTGLPDIIVARNQRVGEQIGDRINSDLMDFIGEKNNEKI